jgi:hypothetical protein
MKDLSVKNVKLHEDMSEETPCFSADVYKDGKLFAHAKNDGRGGSSLYYPAKGVTNKEIDYLAMGLDEDSHIMQLVEEYDFVTKNQGKGLVLKGENNGWFTYKFPSGESIAHKKKSPTFYSWLENQRKRLKADGYEIINRNL